MNEVPTFRADQMPYGGVRDSGNTREGPHYAVEEMTEARLVVAPGRRPGPPVTATVDLAGKVALVTGGGVGDRAGDRGPARRRRARASASSTSTRPRAGRSPPSSAGRSYAADVGRLGADVDAAFAHCIAEFGGVDIAFLNAGIAIGVTRHHRADRRRVPPDHAVSTSTAWCSAPGPRSAR